MSTIKVDTYLTRGGASEIAIDKLKGASSAGSMTVVGEGGTTTTNLQQGIAKAWHKSDTTASSDDSFNISGGTDNGTGDYTYAFTNSMNSSLFSPTGLCVSDDRNCQYARSRATANYRVRHYGHDDAFADVDNSGTVHGDLA